MPDRPTTPDAPTALTARPATIDDVDAIHEIAVLAGEALGQPALATRSEIVADLVHPAMNPETDTMVLLGDGDLLLSYQVIYTDRPGRTFLDIYLRPDLDPELVQHLLDRQLEVGINRACDDAVARGLTETTAISGAQQVDTAMFEAFERHGLHLARTFWRMQIDLDADAPPSAPTLPEGVAVVTVDPGDPDVVRRLYAIDEAAFARHYGHVPVDLETWTTELANQAGHDPTFCRIAQVDGVDAALLIGSDRMLDDGLGYIDILGVLEEYRGRGLGRLLLQDAFAEYAARGRVGVRLNVDSDNASGATRLYEAVGMRPDEVIDTWELVISVDAPEVLDAEALDEQG